MLSITYILLSLCSPPEEGRGLLMHQIQQKPGPCLDRSFCRFLQLFLTTALSPPVFCLEDSSCLGIPKLLTLSPQLTESVRLSLVSLTVLWHRNFLYCGNNGTHLICFLFLKNSCPALPIVPFCMIFYLFDMRR